MPKVSAPSTLVGEAKRVWEEIYQSAWKSWDSDKTDKDREAYSAAAAWAGLKNAGYKKNKDTGKWVKKSLNVNFRLRITKSRVDGRNGKVKWHANAASDELDVDTGEVLHLDLFDDLAATFTMIRKAYDNGKPPPIFDTDLGPARDPIIDLSHYSALLVKDARNKARLGEITKLYRDGRYLHAEGYFDDTPQAQAVTKSIAADENGEIRVSVGFFPDWGNIEIKDEVLYFKGGRQKAYLDHLAVTSVPRIKSTSIGLMEEVTMSDAITMADDAKRVLGDSPETEDIIEGLEQAITDQLESRSDAMILRADADTTESDETEVVTEQIPTDQEPVEEPEMVTDSETETEAGGETQKVTSLEEPVTETGVEDVIELEDTPVEDTPDMVTEADAVPVVIVDEIEPYRPLGGATSFDSALETERARQESWRIEDGWQLLQQVMDNIMCADEEIVPDKKAAIDGALAQYQAFLNSDQRIYSEAEGETDVVETTENVDEVEEELTTVEEPVVIAPVAVEPPEASPMSVVEADTASETPHRLGRASSWDEVVNRLSSVDAKPRRKAIPQQLVQQSETPTAVAADELEQLISNQIAYQVAEAVKPLVQQMEQLQQTLSDAPPAPRVQRKSQTPLPPVGPASVTSKAKTFSDVLNRLLESRSGRERITPK